MTKHYIRREGWYDYFIVKIYKSARNMRIGITKDGGEPDNTCVGLVRPTNRLIKEGYVGEFTSNMFATMYLNEEYLTIDIISHECTHMAFAHERFVARYRMDYGAQCGRQEERLAYYLGDISMAVVRMLRRGGYIR